MKRNPTTGEWALTGALILAGYFVYDNYFGASSKAMSAWNASLSTAYSMMNTLAVGQSWTDPVNGIVWTRTTTGMVTSTPKPADSPLSAILSRI